ncbi:phytoene/squalene synthase family protein [Luteimonas gilva]|uniref:Phytoene/squalene synthase family protein n=2 Tax=Luteimonas gilva TaxID=2572684 RepID=A0A4U5JW50_9GAMM|nr:phytoene/squalene synthase family protein [Luteimonas gilva]
MTDPAALDSFIAKWRARWPEWTVAETFVSVSQREIAAAWFALLQELTDAAWGGEDPTPGIAKLAWWQEELRGWSRGLRRHPLGIALQRQAAPWPTLEAALPALRTSRAPPADAKSALAGLRAFAAAAGAVEQSLFSSSDGADAIAACLLAGHPHWPAETGHREDLIARWPPVQGSRPRRIAAALARARLRKGAPLPLWRALWLAWRAARH